MADLIDRQAAYDVLSGYYHHNTEMQHESLREALGRVPSVQGGQRMTYEQIQEANATIRTTDVRGKEYAEVNQRVKAFRMLYPEGTIETTMLSNEGEPGRRVCVFRAEVGYFNRDESGETWHVLATGTAYENEGASTINRTSYIENCETSAVGRALGFLGLGVDVAIASAEEVKGAIAQQAEPPRAPKEPPSPKISDVQVKALVALLKANGLQLAALLHHYKVKHEAELTEAQYVDALERIKKWAAKNEGKEEDEA